MYARYNIDQGNSTQIQDASLANSARYRSRRTQSSPLTRFGLPRIFNETKFGYNGIKMRVQGIAGPSPNADISKARIAVAGLTNVGSAHLALQLLQRRRRSLHRPDLLLHRQPLLSHWEPQHEVRRGDPTDWTLQRPDRRNHLHLQLHQRLPDQHSRLRSSSSATSATSAPSPASAATHM